MWIAAILIIIVCIASNLINKYDGNNSNRYMYSYSDSYMEYIQEELNKLHPENASDNSSYIELHTTKDIIELIREFGEDSWQAEVIESDVQPVIKELNLYEYGLEKNEQKLKEVKKEYEEIKKKLKEDNWKYFANKQLKETTESLEENKKAIEKTIDKSILSNLNIEQKSIELEKQIATWRVEKEIPYGNNYQNKMLQNYKDYQGQCYHYESNQGNLSFLEKQKYYNYMKKANLARYDIEHGVQTQETASARGGLINLFSSYEVFIVMILVIVAGIMISEEFNKGTIKLLLVKPYKRTTILLSKFITCILMVIITTLFVGIVQFIVGGIIFGWGSLTLPVMEFDYVSKQIVSMNLLKYLVLQFITHLPIYILILTLAFALSTLTLNSPLAIALPLLGYMGSSFINILAQERKLTWVKFFVTPNWDLSQYLFGGLPMLENMTCIFSILICAVYFIIMIVPTFITFKKRNIKNV